MTTGARRGVTAQARTTDGWPVATAVLTVTDAIGAQVARVPADEDGRLATEQLPAGYYKPAILTAIGFAPLARTAVVTASGSATLGVLALARIAGRRPAGIRHLDDRSRALADQRDRTASRPGERARQVHRIRRPDRAGPAGRTVHGARRDPGGQQSTPATRCATTISGRPISLTWSGIR